MYSNIGRKIKGVAVAGCILGIIASLIIGFLLISNSSNSNPTATMGWVILIVGSVSSWLGSFCLYGFGELIEKTSANNDVLLKIERELKIMNSKSHAQDDKNPIKDEVCMIAARRNMESELQASAKMSSSQNVHVYRYPLKHYNGICPNCGSKFNKNTDSDTCTSCGAKFASK